MDMTGVKVRQRKLGKDEQEGRVAFFRYVINFFRRKFFHMTSFSTHTKRNLSVFAIDGNLERNIISIQVHLQIHR